MCILLVIKAAAFGIPVVPLSENQRGLEGLVVNSGSLSPCIEQCSWKVARHTFSVAIPRARGLPQRCLSFEVFSQFNGLHAHFF